MSNNNKKTEYEKQKSNFNENDKYNSFLGTINQETQIWDFINKSVSSTLKDLLNSKEQIFKDERDFFKNLSDTIMTTLSNDGKLLSLHKNTIKALPKVINLIYILKKDQTKSLSGERLLEITDLKGQHKKVQLIANYLNIPLPFINALEIEKILNSKKNNILNGDFFHLGTISFL